MAFYPGGVFIVPHLLWHGTSVFAVSALGPPHFFFLCYNQRVMGTYSNPGYHMDIYYRIVKLTWGPYLMNRETLINLPFEFPLF